MDIKIVRKHDSSVDILDATDAFAKEGFYNVRCGPDLLIRYPISEIREVEEHGRAA